MIIKYTYMQGSYSSITGRNVFMRLRVLQINILTLYEGVKN